MKALSVLAMVLATSAQAADWRYCLAQDEDARRIYVTSPFQSDRPLQVLEAQFNAWLQANEVNAATGGICPRAISQFGPAEDVQAAINYNRGLGLKAVPISWLPTGP